MLSGKSVYYNSSNFEKVNNYYKIPDEILGIIMEISADDEDYKKISGPYEFSIYTRQFDGTILVRDSWSYDGTYPEESMVWKITNGKTEQIASQAKEEKCNYIIINNFTEMEDDLINYGFYVFHKTPTYTVYKLSKGNSNWKVTQYGNNNGKQQMCYTIEGDESGLIIVDGGYEDDEETLSILERKISENYGIVDAWILTHFDDDHAGAYLTISDRRKDFIIKNLYVQDTPDIETCKLNADWYTDEDWKFYERCLNIDVPEKKFVYAGDKIENIIGLDLEVLSSYDDWIDEKTNNLLNNGSIIFKLYGNKESILFCADAQVKVIEDFLMDNYKDKLQSEYLQVGHHGNNWFSDEFYKTVNPKVALFPTPQSIMLNEAKVDWYTTEKLTNLFNEMKTKIYYFKDSQAQIVLK